jgi:hypothetical protein
MATMFRTGGERIRVRSIRWFIMASQHWGQPAKTESPYVGLDSTGKGMPGLEHARIQGVPASGVPVDRHPITKPTVLPRKSTTTGQLRRRRFEQIGPFGAVSLDPAQHPPARAIRRIPREGSDQPS